MDAYDTIKTRLNTIITAAQGALSDIAVLEAPVVTTPPPAPGPWPRRAPDMLDLDLVNQNSLLAAKWLDGNPGFDGKGGAIHYGDMSGPVDSWNPFVIPGKLSNGSCPPKWGVEPSGLHYLESGTDGTKEIYAYGSGSCATCRLINWRISRFSADDVYYRFMFFAYPETWTNQTELGIKLSGIGGSTVTGGTFAEIFELGKKNTVTGGWFLQAYRYDAEGDQQITVFPDVDIQPGRWYTLEGRVKASTGNATYVDSAGRTKIKSNNDGVTEFKVDGKLVYSRSDVNLGANAVTTFQVQEYHGGTRAPAGILRMKVARPALSRGGWIGPAPEVGLP